MTAPEAVLPGGRFAVVRASPLAVVCGAMAAAALPSRKTIPISATLSRRRALQLELFGIRWII